MTNRLTMAAVFCVVSGFWKSMYFSVNNYKPNIEKMNASPPSLLDEMRWRAVPGPIGYRNLKPHASFKSGGLKVNFSCPFPRQKWQAFPKIK